MRTRDNRTTIDGLRIGHTVEIVRWVMRFDNWEPVTVSGAYVARDSESITLTVAGEPRSFNRSEWELCFA